MMPQSDNTAGHTEPTDPTDCDERIFDPEFWRERVAWVETQYNSSLEKEGGHLITLYKSRFIFVRIRLFPHDGWASCRDGIKPSLLYFNFTNWYDLKNILPDKIVAQFLEHVAKQIENL